jgi:hypothetical protein
MTCYCSTDTKVPVRFDKPVRKKRVQKVEESAAFAIGRAAQLHWALLASSARSS